MNQKKKKDEEKEEEEEDIWKTDYLSIKLKKKETTSDKVILWIMFIHHSWGLFAIQMKRS